MRICLCFERAESCEVLGCVHTVSVHNYIPLLVPKSMAFIGSNSYGQLGVCNGYNECQFGDNLPALDFGTHFVPKMMGLGYVHSCFVSTNGSLVCFGWNNYGQVQ